MPPPIPLLGRLCCGAGGGAPVGSSAPLAVGEPLQSQPSPLGRSSLKGAQAGPSAGHGVGGASGEVPPPRRSGRNHRLVAPSCTGVVPGNKTPSVVQEGSGGARRCSVVLCHSLPALSIAGPCKGVAWRRRDPVQFPTVSSVSIGDRCESEADRSAALASAFQAAPGTPLVAQGSVIPSPLPACLTFVIFSRALFLLLRPIQRVPLPTPCSRSFPRRLRRFASPPEPQLLLWRIPEALRRGPRPHICLGCAAIFPSAWGSHRLFGFLFALPVREPRAVPSLPPFGGTALARL
ncbi:uncharacterized protein LOC132709239 [Pantherophis guttatus]|uniref:Uncharacterized protein LOC132709239 n=1 Tax=Pantherophis guttatus TaxID=94885 RepID=A0ABM3YQD1_PANGU|nr:uncharacterized protein LOC132709239 [Pantherophis guttatus]